MVSIHFVVYIRSHSSPRQHFLQTPPFSFLLHGCLCIFSIFISCVNFLCLNLPLFFAKNFSVRSNISVFYKITKMVAAFHGLMSLRTGRVDWRIKVRVIRKWTVESSFFHEKISSIELILLDIDVGLHTMQQYYFFSILFCFLLGFLLC